MNAAVIKNRTSPRGKTGYFRWCRMDDGRVLGYHYVHQQIRKLFGSARWCWSCGDDDVRCDWHSKSAVTKGHYSFKGEDWTSLCRPCHRRADRGEQLQVRWGIRPEDSIGISDSVS